MINFLLGIATSLIASFIFAFLLYGKTIFSLRFGDIRLFWSISKRLRSNGVVNFFASRADYIRYRKDGTVNEYISTSQRELIYVGLWLSHGTEMTNIGNTLVSLLKRGCYIELIFLNPEVSYIDSVADFLALTTENMVFRINQSITQMKALRRSLPESLKPRFVLKTHTKLLTSSAFFIDQDTDSVKILVDFKLFGLGREQTFGLEFGEVSALNSLYNRVVSSFMEIRKQSIVVPD